MSDDILARNVKRFDGTNFQAWKFHLKALFTTNGIRDVVEGTRVRPVDAAAAAATTWECDNAKAMFLITSSMEPSCLDSLMVCTIAKDIWDKVCTMHEQKAVANKMGLLQEFHEYRMGPNYSIEQHLAKVQNMAANLIDLDETISDNIVISKLLSSLPPKYSTL